MPAIPDAPKRITPADLRSECQACGGSGAKVIREVQNFPLLKNTHTILRTVAGGCEKCGGYGRTIPRKVDI